MPLRSVAQLAVLLLLLAVLVGLQLRWTDELAAARLAEQRRLLQGGVERLASDLDGLVERLVEATALGWPARLRPGDGELIARRALVIRDATGVWRSDDDRAAAHLAALDPRAAAVLPGPCLWVPPVGDAPGQLLWLDRQRLASVTLPRLARQAFGAESLALYRITIDPAAGDDEPLYASRPALPDDGPADAQAATLRPPEPLLALFSEDGERWTAFAGSGDDGLPGTGALTLLHPRQPESPLVVRSGDEPSAEAQAGTRLWLDDKANTRALVEPTDSPPAPQASGTGHTADADRWTADTALDTAAVRPPPSYVVRARHRDGSLAAALGARRQRELLLGGAVVILLGLAAATIWRAEQRRRRLAERELAWVAGISHELRTPVATLRLAASNLQQGVLAEREQVVEYGALIGQQAERMGALVERALRFARGEGSAEPGPVDLPGLLTAVAADARLWSDRRRACVDVELADDLPPFTGDTEGLRSALQNLIDNALRHGPDEQRVTLRAAVRGGRLLLSVEDAGPGIPTRERNQLRRPFRRGRHAREAGSGLGLAVVEQVAAAHGGELLLDSSSAGGLCATLALPLP